MVAGAAAEPSDTPSGRPVLELTRRMDATADLVVEELHRREVPVVRFDTGDFPQQLRLTARLRDGWAGPLTGATRSLLLDAVRSVYYRRPTMFRMSDRIPEAALAWTREEARRGLGGVLAGLRCWINHLFDPQGADRRRRHAVRRRDHHRLAAGTRLLALRLPQHQLPAIDVPNGVGAAVLRLLAQLRLRFAAMDFVVTRTASGSSWRSTRAASGPGSSRRPACR